jgi:uncharacterized protein
LVRERLPGREHLSVQWFGGEPLAAISVIDSLSEAFMELATKENTTYAATVITNGYLLTSPVSALLARRGVQLVQITLDGDRSLHDRVRFQNRQQGSFDVILDNVRYASLQMSIKLRVHVAPYNLASVFSLLDTLAEEKMQSHIAQIYFAPLFNYRPHMTGQPYATDGKRFMNARNFAEVQVQLLQKAAMAGFRIPDPLDVSYGVCTAVRESTLVVDASGSLVKCYKDVGVADQAIGTLAEGVTNGPMLQKWMDLPLPRDEECRACRFLPICLGGCSKQWQEQASKDVICTPLRYNSEEIIRLYFRHSASVGDR